MSKRTDVLDAMKTRLEAVDGSGDYNNAFKVVNREPVPLDTGKMPYASIHEGEERYDDKVGSLIIRDIDILIEAGARREGDDTSSDAANKLLEDVERAIMADRSLGGEAVDVTMRRNDTFRDAVGDSLVVVILQATIQYRHPHGSP